MLKPKKFTVYTTPTFDRIPQIKSLAAEQRWAMKALAHVLPFRVNNYVIDELIDWDNIPADPIYQLTFPQPGMLEHNDVNAMIDLLRKDASTQSIRQLANKIRFKLNPHPAGQMQYNVPEMNGEPLSGMQHKYRETVLFFPSQGQTCHSYCTYCFRWAQFVGIQELKFAAKEAESFHKYLCKHKEVSDVLFTGGDPMVMKLSHLKNYIEPLLGPEFAHIRNIRIGTKSVAYWPQRFTHDEDANDLLRFFRQIIKAGKQVAIMAHYSHPRELSTPAAEQCVRRILTTGAVIRCQSPVVRHVNDSGDLWAQMWRKQVQLGCVPYYMFVERDTGPKQYFEIPLVECYQIFKKAYSQVSGLARTARGPSMSATPGKVQIMGVTEIKGEKVIMLNFIQGRNPDWVRRPFFAQYNQRATWLDDLQPAFGEREFFFSKELRQLSAKSA